MTQLLRYWARRKVLILSFHDILTTSDPLQPDAVDSKRFDLLLDWLQENFEVIELGSAIRSMTGSQKPMACITFDDGYPNWVTQVLPRLNSRRMHATFFVCTDSLHTGIHWHQRVLRLVRALPALSPGHHFTRNRNFPSIDTLSVMTRIKSIHIIQSWLKNLTPIERDIRLNEMESYYQVLGHERSLDSSGLIEIAAAGHSIGAHTISHPILSRISAAQARKEIIESKDILFEKTRTPIEGFAYPNGKPNEDFNLEHVSMVQSAGYSHAVTTLPGVSSQKENPYLLKRFTPWGQTQRECTRQTLGTICRDFFR